MIMIFCCWAIGPSRALGGIPFFISWRWVRNMVRVIARTRNPARIITLQVAAGVLERRRDRRSEQLGVGKLLSLRVGEEAAALALLRRLVEEPEQPDEDRHLDDQRKTRGERVGPGVLVELHRLLAEELPVVAVLLLQLLDLRLEQLQVALGLDLLDEQRDQRRADHEGQPDDRQRPGGTRGRAEDVTEDLVPAQEDCADQEVQRLMMKPPRSLKNSITQTPRVILGWGCEWGWEGGGTGSYPPGVQGWQRSRRRRASQLPLRLPCTVIASSA